MKVYFGAPLFNEMELRRNEEETNKLRAAGFEVALPQELGKNSDIDFGPEAESSNTEARKAIFMGDINAMKVCDIMLAFMDGRSVDEGTCFEMGWMNARNTPVYGICTDFRYFAKNAQFNLMLEFGCERIFKSTEAFIDYWKTEGGMLYTNSHR